MGATRFPNGLSVSPDGEPLRLEDLDDVEIKNPADGDVLVFDGGTGKWVNEKPAAA